MEAASAGAGVATPLRSEEWLRAARLTRLLSWLSLVWLGIEGAVAIVAGVMAGSIALIAFGLDSAIEGVASVVIIWRFSGSRIFSERAERRAQVARRRAVLHPRPVHHLRGRGEARDRRPYRNELARDRPDHRHARDLSAARSCEAAARGEARVVGHRRRGHAEPPLPLYGYRCSRRLARQRALWHLVARSGGGAGNRRRRGTGGAQGTAW